MNKENQPPFLKEKKIEEKVFSYPENIYKDYKNTFERLSLDINKDHQSLSTLFSFLNQIFLKQEEEVVIEEVYDDLNLKQLDELYQEFEKKKENLSSEINLKIENFLSDFRKLKQINNFIQNIDDLKSRFEEIESNFIDLKTLFAKIERIELKRLDLILKNEGFDSVDSLISELNSLYKDLDNLEKRKKKLDTAYSSFFLKILKPFNILNKRNYADLKKQKEDIIKRIKNLTGLKEEISRPSFQQDQYSSVYLNFENFKRELFDLLLEKSKENLEYYFNKIDNLLKELKQFLLKHLFTESKIESNEQIKDYLLNSLNFSLFKDLYQNYSLIGLIDEIHRNLNYPYSENYYSFKEILNKIHSRFFEVFSFFSNVFADSSFLERNFYFQQWIPFKEQFKDKKGVYEFLNFTEEKSLDFFEYSLFDKFSSLPKEIKRLNISESLLSFKTPKAILLNILNSFVEPGKSGDYPFIFGEQNCEILKYLKSLDEEQIERLENFVNKEFEIEDLISFIKDLKSKPDISIKDYNQLLIKTLNLSFQFFDKNNNNQDRIDFVFKVFSILIHQMPTILKDFNRDLNENQLFIFFKFLSENSYLISIKDFYFNSREFLKKIFKFILNLKNLDILEEKGISFLKQYCVFITSLFIEDENLPFVLEVLHKLTNLSKEDLEEGAKIILFLMNKKYNFSYSPLMIKDLIEFFSDKSNIDFIETLINEFSYYFDMNDLPILKSLVKEKDDFLKKCKEAKSFYPEFRYFIIEEKSLSYNVTFSDPYEILAYHFDYRDYRSKDFFDFFNFLMSFKKNGQIQLYNKILESLIKVLKIRFKIYVFEDEKILQEDFKLLSAFVDKITDETNPIFYYLTNLPEGYHRSKTIEYIIKIIFKSKDKGLKVLDEIIDKDFISLIQPGGPLYLNRYIVFEQIYSNSDSLLMIYKIKRYFSRQIPYWKFLFLYTSLRIEEALKYASSEYPIKKILNIPLKNIREKRLYKILSEEIPEDVKRNTIEKIKSGEIESIPFKDLSDTAKKLVFRDFIRRTIIDSRDEHFKKITDKRNREIVKENKKLFFKEGMYLHGSAIDFLDSVLLNGNLPREALGETASTDAFPFHVDFSRLTRDFINKFKGNISDIISASLSSSYGFEGKYDSKGQIFYLYPRPSERRWEQNIDYQAAQEDHGLILGGMPSTEILGIILNDPETTLEIAKRRIVENGFYIPLYNREGDLIFPPEEYDRIYNDLNMSVKVEVWDFSFKTGDQKGSNPGAEYTLPPKIKGAEPEKYYVKFASLDESERVNQLWCEFLADEIYRIFDIPVPETKIVKVEGVYGRASRLIKETVLEEEDLFSNEDFLNGFLIDVLLANWDILYTASQNVVLANDKRLYRIDNGGALIFRARGERKNIKDLLDEGIFKQEIEKIISVHSLKEKEEKLKTQAARIKEILTNEKIKELANKTRLSLEDRNLIEELLKTRRDFILKYYGIEK